MQELTIGGRFTGFPRAAHGGYAAGALARLVGDAAEVYLRSAPPVERPLALEQHDGWLLARDGETLVMQARAGGPGDLEVPLRPTVAEARAASDRFPRPGWFPSCFVCSTTREDTLGVHPGPLGRDDAHAALWPAGGDPVTPELVWSAFDCATAWVVSGPGPALTGHIAASVERALPQDQPLVVVAWPLRVRGRKREAGAALLDDRGEVLARGVYTWIGVDRLPDALY